MAVRAYICHSVILPWKVSQASINATKAMTLWVTNSTLRRLAVSATAPPMRENRITGRMRASPIAPKAIG